MLTEAENQLLTQTGPGTPAGRLLRSYWQPVALASEVPPGGAPVPLKILGEQLVLFRDEEHRLGLLGLRCSHRGADLSYGRLEGGGLRCLYHGWLYDVHGNCLEQPGEPLDSTYYLKIKHKAYPCREAAGVVLAYLGEGAPPELPPMGIFRVPVEHTVVRKYHQECNYLQANEGNIDPTHQSFLHRYIGEDTRRGSAVASTQATNYALYRQDVRPRMELEETNYGLRIYVIRDAGDRKRFVRIYNFLMPNASVIPGGVGPAGYSINWHVPVDDHNHLKFMMGCRWDRPFTDEEQQAVWTEVTPDFRMVRNAGNRYLHDRQEMATLWFAGLGPNFAVHDAFATEQEGPIQDRTEEHLATSDKAIAAARRQMLRTLRDQEEGSEPLGVFREGATDWADEMVVHTELLPEDENLEGYRARVLQQVKAALAGLKGA